jgi:hypothetical protein
MIKSLCKLATPNFKENNYHHPNFDAKIAILHDQGSSSNNSKPNELETVPRWQTL